jgi:hypothetical protein
MTSLDTSLPPGGRSQPPMAFQWLRGSAPIRSGDALAAFLRAEAAFLAQRTTIEYCRARSGLNWSKLFKEAAFIGALDRARWEAFASVLEAMVLTVEGVLRAHAAGAEPRLAERLVALHREILGGYAPPAHRPEGWADYLEALPRRLAQVQLGPPHGADPFAGAAGERVFEVLPIHPRLRGHDREMVVNSVRFGMVAFMEKLQRRLAAPDLAASLLAA